LTKHITQFLLELGKGFAFIGKQYHLEIGEKDYYIDLSSDCLKTSKSKIKAGNC